MTKEEAKSEIMQIYGALSPNKQRAIDTLVKIEPCEDCISRKSVIEEMEKRHAEGDYITKGFINNLPPVKQEPKTDVLDKIRAEMVDLGQRTMNDNRASGIWTCVDILDKYKAESEVQE